MLSFFERKRRASLPPQKKKESPRLLTQAPLSAPFSNPWEYPRCSPGSVAMRPKKTKKKKEEERNEGEEENVAKRRGSKKKTQPSFLNPHFAQPQPQKKKLPKPSRPPSRRDDRPGRQADRDHSPESLGGSELAREAQAGQDASRRRRLWQRRRRRLAVPFVRGCCHCLFSFSLSSLRR